jgi:hypothetical protein
VRIFLFLPLFCYIRLFQDVFDNLNLPNKVKGEEAPSKRVKEEVVMITVMLKGQDGSETYFKVCIFAFHFAMYINILTSSNFELIQGC